MFPASFHIFDTPITRLTHASRLISVMSSINVLAFDINLVLNLNMVWVGITKALAYNFCIKGTIHQIIYDFIQKSINVTPFPDT